MRYRNVLYKEYHRTQSGRFAKDSYERQFRNDQNIFEREILPYVANTPKAAKILDMGCGTGSLLSALQLNGFINTQGIDLSEDQLSIARIMNVKNVSHGDATSLIANQLESLELFAYGLSTRHILLSPNMIVVATAPNN